MKEYLINSGKFNIVVLPEEKHYFILENDRVCGAIAEDFIQGRNPDYGALQPHWFKYGADEIWHDFDGKKRRLSIDMSELELIEHFVLKKFNFGSLVAIRDTETGKVQVFKRDKLYSA